MNIMASKVVVVGSSNTDMVVQVQHLPGPGETMMGTQFFTAAGGKGANQAVAAARLGAAVTFVARVGADSFGETAVQHFQREGLDTTYVIQDANAPSGVALIMVDADGQNLIAVAPGANGRLTPDDIREVAFAGVGAVLLQLETPLETVLAAAQAGRQAGAVVILNPAPARPLPDSLLPLIDILTPNESEAERLTGQPVPAMAAAALLARGVKTVIVTLGEAGVLLATADGVIEPVPGFKVTAVDSTSAGDAFNGGLAAMLARGEPLDTAVQVAQAVAALSVTKVGAQPSLPNQTEVAAFLSVATR